ncbi:hypothetical protein EOA13_24630 [Mesorhizobium sp. M7A.F.Ca.US.011.01.1.1]|uniref:hypothetical protein n=1 Tax=Mesorhizobium sp. M7A.F.Ca.US.011.01.1.1 TaxID=2496741 RepID=UPI000FCC50D5|nr:hypothetical protein [Mesorhizobium sp. M7A.F.Ca.US.011.01.1.1]RUX26161.1 hypothetical protein EOA13_24630 [Mesorhizobium sp. M7A.F.Ca.US.011.01.1.1]
MISKAVTSPVLGVRLADLQARMRDARVTDAEMKTFQKVAAIMEDRHGRIDADDLIAASFLADPVQDPANALSDIPTSQQTF